MKNKIRPGILNKRAKRSFGIYRKLTELQLLLRCFKSAKHVKKQKTNTDIYPFRLNLQPHTDCNAECIICPHKDIRKKFPKEKMDMKLYKKIISDFASDKRAKFLNLSLQCEPLMDDMLFERISFFQKHNIHNISCFLSTNGILLNREICDKLLNSGLDIIQISINALSKDNYKKINQGKDFDELMNNINYFINQDLSKIGVYISFVRTTIFEKELSIAVKKWRKLGFEVMIHRFSNRGGALKDFDKFVVRRRNVSIVTMLKRYLIKRLSPYCPYTFHEMSILSNGKAILCTHDWERKTIIGDLNKQTIHEIWNSARMNEIRYKIISGKYEQIAACKECMVHKTYTHI